MSAYIDETVHDLYPNGEDQSPAFYDTDNLMRRIAALTPERSAAFGQKWQEHGWGQLPQFLSVEDYADRARLLERYEEIADIDHAHVFAWQELEALPPHVAENAKTAIQVYAGLTSANALTVTVGQLAEVLRIVEEAKAYAATLPPAPDPDSVADVMPDGVEVPPQISSEQYPGAKADPKVISRWVAFAEDPIAKRNRAGRAYIQERQRATQRKGVLKELTALLGEDGVARCEQALADATDHAPLDLSSTGLQPGEDSAGSDEAPAESTAGEGDSGMPPASDEATPSPVVEEEPAVLSPPPPTLGDLVGELDRAAQDQIDRTPLAFDFIRGRDGDGVFEVVPVADALDLIGAGFTALAAAVREGAR